MREELKSAYAVAATYVPVRYIAVTSTAHLKMSEPVSLLEKHPLGLPIHRVKIPCPRVNITTWFHAPILGRVRPYNFYVGRYLARTDEELR